ncbi:MAG: Imm51 family immunity protein [Myxococcota bacterium]
MSTKLEIFLKLVDIAQDVYESSDDLDDDQKAWLLESLEWERKTAPTAPTRSLSQLQSQFLTAWNEGVGRDVERFWERVEQSDIELDRRDRVREALDAGKLGTPDLFFALEDHFAFFEDSDKLDDDEIEELARLMDAFADAPENQYLFGGPDESLVDDEDPTEFDLDLSDGQIVRIVPGRYRFDYWGMQRYEYLHDRGFQGGGYSWAGIAYGLLELHAPKLRSQVEFDPEGDCLCVYGSDVAALEKLAGLISDAVDSDTMLDAGIEVALERSSME